MPFWFGNAAAQPTDPPFAQWTNKEQELFLRRIGHADVAAIGIIRAVASFERKENPVELTLVFTPNEILHGSLKKALDEHGEVLLSLDDRDLDFQRAVKVQRRLPGKRYLVFFKKRPAERRKTKGTGWKASLWRPPPEPLPSYRWSLYRPEKALVDHVRALYRLLAKR